MWKAPGSACGLLEAGIIGAGFGVGAGVAGVVWPGIAAGLDDAKEVDATGADATGAVGATGAVFDATFACGVLVIWTVGMTGSTFGVSATGAVVTAGLATGGVLTGAVGAVSAIGVAGFAAGVDEAEELISIIGRLGGIKDGPTGAGGGGKMPF